MKCRIFITMVQNVARFAIILLALVLLGAAQAAPSASLEQILASIEHFDDASLIALSYWASYPNPQAPDTPLTDLDRVQVKALTLAPPERDALFSWLDHGGRTKLYALGVTDNDIGPCQALIDLGCRKPQSSVAESLAQGGAGTNSAAAPPAIRRDLLFAIAGAASSASGITLERGFAVMDTSSDMLTHCVTFRNTTAKTAAALTLTYAILGRSGEVLTAGSDILVGSFTAGSEIKAPQTFDEFAQVSLAGSVPTNCWKKSLAATDPVLQRAAGLTIGVTSVTYEDGTHWSL